jgi:hypothetical protein
MKPITVLKKVRKLLSKKERWGKGWFAFDKNHVTCDVSDKHAACFCLSGALQKCGATGELFQDCLEILDNAVPADKGKNCLYYNDSRYTTHAHILRLLERAIRSLEP